MSEFLIVLLVLVGIVLIVAMWFIGTMNGLKQLEVKVNEAESGIDVALEKRFDMLTKLVATTKGYAKHESETLENVTKWRAGLPKSMTMEDKQKFMGQMDAIQTGINVQIEAYPDLKADKLFLDLQHSIRDVEEHLQAARRMYNANVSTINSRIVTFPTSVVAGMVNVMKKEFFEADVNKRTDVEITF